MSAADAQNYRTIQQWVQAVITHPGGSVAGVDSVEARSHIAVDSSSIDQVVEPSATMSAMDRIGVYASMYFARLVECIAEDFPACRQALGEQRFDELAKKFLLSHPSKTHTLNTLGRGFPPYLRDEVEGLEHRAFIIELATLERTIDDVFHEPSHERVSAKVMQAIPADRWLDVRLSVAASLRLLAFTTPCNAYLQAVLDDHPMTIPTENASWVVVYRSGYTVGRLELSECQYCILHALSEGQTLGEAMHAIRGDDQTVSTKTSSLAKWFKQWSSCTFFTGIEF